MALNWGQAVKGGIGGGLGGAGVGGPIGAAIGGGIGFLGGLFSGGENPQDAQNRKMLMDYYRSIGNREAPQTGPAAQAGYSGFRSNQADFVNRLEAISRGLGPSLAAQQFREATDRNQAGQAAMANSGRGGPLMAMQAANNMGLLGAQAAQGSASARIAEQNMALGHLGQALTAGRAADESTNQFNAGQQNQTALANMDARLRAMGMNDQARLQILSQLGGLNAQQNQMNQVGFGDQMLAGGAGLFSLGASQAAQKKMG